MKDNAAFYYLCLLRIKGIGGFRVIELIRNADSSFNAWEKIDVTPSTKRQIENGVSQEIEKCEAQGFSLSCPSDASYPFNLKDFASVAPVVYSKGQYSPVDDLAVGVVGTRRFSDYGKEAAEFFVDGLARAKVTVVSGLMRGIDTFAHYQALKSGGRTLAVLGSGINVVVPPENRDLYDQIAKSGAVFSQFPLDLTPTAYTFPIRDELIAALSKVILVIEAPLKSGALITAKAALDQGKEVFVVPGEIFSPQSEGCHELIKNGARLVTNPQEILEDLGISAHQPKGMVDLDDSLLSSEEKTILGLLSQGVNEVN